MTDDKLVPPSELVQAWENAWLKSPPMSDMRLHPIYQAAAWGAQQQRAKDAAIADTHASIEGIAQDMEQIRKLVESLK